MSSQPSNPTIAQIRVDEMAQRLTIATESLQLIDVREPHEVAIASLEGFESLPLSQFAEWSDQIIARFDPHRETLVMCHHGVRSAQMCQWLLHQGFTNVKNVQGGIDAYSIEVDSAIPRY